ncbi:MAG: hypothetical protein LBI04_06670, partial [Treponema sp.]|nr:hypothetical protein [Treponema sp.]
MKRFWLLAVALLAIAGIFIFGCTSDPEPDKPYKGPVDLKDLVLKGGRHLFEFTEPVITAGTKYEVLLVIEGLPTSIIGCHPGGSICYKMNMTDENEEDNILSGWKNPEPSTIAGATKEYVWEFEAGNLHSSSGATIANNGSTPNGATQYFSLIVQTSDWHDPVATVDYAIKCGFKITAKENVEYNATGTDLGFSISTVTGEKEDKNFTDENMTKIRAVDTRSKIVLTVTVDSLDTDRKQPGWGIGKIGNPNGADNK